MIFLFRNVIFKTLFILFSIGLAFSVLPESFIYSLSGGDYYLMNAHSQAYLYFYWIIDLIKNVIFLGLELLTDFGFKR